MKNLLFIPAYRCAPQIERVIRSLPGVSSHFDEIIIIDNRSPDDTVKVAAESIRKHNLSSARVVINPDNVGLGGSHKLAFDYAIKNGFDHAVILHGDDQGNIHDVIPLLEEMRSTTLTDFWMGARFHPQSKIEGYSAFRIFGNLCFNVLSSILTTRTIYDFGGSGVNIFPVQLLKTHDFRKYSNDLTFHVFLLLNAIRKGQGVRFTPISWREDDQISNVKLLSQSLKLVRILKKNWSDVEVIEDKSFAFSSDQWISA